MTPLAQWLAHQSTRKIADRTFEDRRDVLKHLSDIHCFDLTGAFALLEDMIDRYFESDFVFENQFWPAPKTFIEFYSPSFGRVGVLCVADSDAPGACANCYVFTGNKRSQRGLGMLVVNFDDVNAIMNDTAFGEDEQADALGFIDEVGYFVRASIQCINSPQLINRKTHMPHAGLQRKLAKARGLQGRFPLHAWTELTLRPFATRDAAGEVQEIHLTGKRCLHFVRAHLRPKSGIIVRSHWRGDGSLGIKRTRYRVAS